jgi:hypothetical protein
MKLPIAKYRILAAGCVWLAAWSFAAAQQAERPTVAGTATPSTADQIARWISELGHNSYSVRQAAAESLLAAGEAAREPLSRIADGPDPELRASARRIIALIQSTDLRRRLDAFAADVDGRAGITLPGWELFQKLVGSDARARALFVEMHRHDAALLAAAFRESSTSFIPAWEARLVRLVQWNALGYRNVPPPLASCTTVLFLSCMPDFEISDSAVDSLVQMVHRPPVQEALETGTNRESMRTLVSAWVIRCTNQNESSVQQRLGVASAYQLAETLPLATSVAIRRDELRPLSPTTRMAALILIGQLGSRANVDALEPLLEDATVCFPAGMVRQRVGAPTGEEVQIRDVALMVMLQLTAQRSTDYGYPHAQRNGRELNPQLMYPSSAEERPRAIAKWKNWKAEQQKARQTEGAPGGKPSSTVDGTSQE